MWLAVSGFMVMGLSLANHSDSEFFLVVHTSFSQDGCQREGFWDVAGHVVSRFDLISSMFLSRTSCHKTTHANGYYGAWPRVGGFNQCASPNKAMMLSMRKILFLGESFKYNLPS